MRYHWGLAVGHLYTHTLSRRHVAPISTNPDIEGLRHDLDMVEQGHNGGNGSPDRDEHPGPMSTNPEMEALRRDPDTVSKETMQIKMRARSQIQ